MLAATIRASEESILPVQSDRADRALHHIGINFDASVVKETREAVPTGECVADRLGELCLLTNQRELGPQPGFEVIENRPAFGLTNGASLIRTKPTDFLLNGVETCDAFERLTGYRRG